MLSERADVSIFQIIFYIPVAILGIILVMRHGLSRDVGWIFLAIFAIFRIIGAIIFIVADQQNPPSVGLFIAAFVFQGIGLSPLLLATSGFLGVVAQNATFTVDKRVSRIVRLAIIVALALSIKAGTDSNPQDANQSSTFKKVSSILLLAIFVILVLQHAYYWMNIHGIIQKSRRMLLVSISCALPFIAVRLAYTVAGAFQSSASGPFNLLTGTFAIYVVMDVLMECIAVLIYITAGMLLPLDKEKDVGNGSNNPSDGNTYYGMSRRDNA